MLSFSFSFRSRILQGFLILSISLAPAPAMLAQALPDPSALNGMSRQEIIERAQQLKKQQQEDGGATAQQLHNPPGDDGGNTSREEPDAAVVPQARKAEPAPEAQASTSNLTSTQQIAVPGAYGSIPSLQDLYSQVDQASGPVERFGMSLFSGTAATAAEDVPVTEDYRLGPGDVVNVDVWGGANEHLTRLIDPQGRIALPDVGYVVLAHQTVSQAQMLVSANLRREFNEVRADVSVARLRKVRVYVVGNVVHPGAYTMPGNSTVLNVLMAAGGPTDTGSLRKLRHLRGGVLLREIDLYNFILRGLDSALEAFENGDTLVVPTVGPQVAVLGAVRRPALYELRNEHSLPQVLELAGGVPVGGTLRDISVDRIVAHESRTTVTLRAGDGAGSAQDSLDNFEVQDGDRVSIRSILPYRDKTIYLEGHVFRPGKLQYHGGMTVADVVRSYQDLLPEPSQHAEIIRLQPPDYKPSVLSFNLEEVIAHRGPAIPLQPFDTVRIFGRYEYDAPQVSIRGEVLRPGEYPLQENMTAADLVRLAGGFKRSAYIQDADLSRYQVDHGQQVLAGHRDIPIGEAVSGKPDSDVLLLANDVLTIRQITGWEDVGTTVSISGEVRHAGSYGIDKGERLSSIIRRAGGLRDTAYPQGAVLERVEVRKFEDRSRSALLSKMKVEAAMANSTAGNDQAKKDAAAMSLQTKEIQDELMNQPATGRLVIHISSDMSKWQNTPVDLEVRPGDQIVIPKRPEFVLVSGEVFNQTALTYVPGKAASWYLRAAGGPTRRADEKSVFVIRANGQVVGQSRNLGFWSDHVLDTRMEPGDTLVVPGKLTTGTSAWKDFAQAAQVMSSMAIAARVATSF